MITAPAIHFDVKTPLDDEAIRRHVEHALSLGLPEARPTPCPRAHPHLKVIAGGPSARLATLDGPTLAVNNALKLFTDQDKRPTYWAGCDPQEHLADFLENAPQGTVYLVASKCHPKVFNALRGKRVLLWHIDDPCVWDLIKDRNPIPTSCSITLTSFALMEMQGWRTFETWGWDGCFMDGRSHANPERLAANPVKIVVGDRIFESTTNWALEAQDAEDKLRMFGHQVTIHGDGMIGAILDYRKQTRAT